MTIKSGTARDIATKAHYDQTDKAGVRYIDHVGRVAVAATVLAYERTGQHDDVTLAVGWLHDVVEDTDVTYNDLREAGASLVQLNALQALTRDKGEVYTKYLERVALNPLARRIKLADLHDNLKPERVLAAGTHSLVRRYTKAYEWLMAIELGLGGVGYDEVVDRR